MVRTLAGLAVVAGLACGCTSRPRPNLLVVTLDTTRADHLGAYGRAGAQTPHLDRLAQEGVVFEWCLTAAPITLPSHSTMFTGTYPLTHGVRDNGQFRLPAEATTLAEILKGAGYATGAAVGAFPLKRETGISQGFDLFDDDLAPDAAQATAPNRGFFFDERPAGRVNDAILPWLRSRDRRPFFAWVHYWDAHQPLIAPAPFSDVFAHDPYQAEIAFVDQNLGVLLDTLERQGLLGNTIVAVLGDHGEGLGEHNEDSHSMLLYNATLHVPFILHGPGVPSGRRVRSRVGTVDLLPTLLELLDLPAAPKVQGRSLVALAKRANDAPPPPDQAYYAETLSPRLSYGWGEMRALFDGPYKYVHGPRPELFSMTEDPAERRNLVEAKPDEQARMKGVLATFLSRNAGASAGAAVQHASPEVRERLAALGYLAGGDAPTAIVETLHDGGIPPQDRVRDVGRWGRTKAALGRGDYLTARELAVPLVRDDPQNAFYRALLAAAYLGLDRLPDATRVVTEAPVVNGQNDAVFLETARRLFATGKREEARRIARDIAARRPSGQAYYLLGEMELALGSADEATRLLREALRVEPQHRLARASLAVRLAEQGDQAGAEKEFLAVIQQHPEFAVAHLNYGTLLLKAGRSAEALSEIRRAVDLEPSYWKAHLALLATLLQRGDRAEADAVFRRVESACPDAGIVQEARGLMGAS